MLQSPHRQGLRGGHALSQHDKGHILGVFPGGRQSPGLDDLHDDLRRHFAPGELPDAPPGPDGGQQRLRVQGDGPRDLHGRLVKARREDRGLRADGDAVAAQDTRLREDMGRLILQPDIGGGAVLCTQAAPDAGFSVNLNEMFVSQVSWPSVPNIRCPP